MYAIERGRELAYLVLMQRLGTGMLAVNKEEFGVTIKVL